MTWLYMPLDPWLGKFYEVTLFPVSSTKDYWQVVPPADLVNIDFGQRDPKHFRSSLREDSFLRAKFIQLQKQSNQ